MERTRFNPERFPGIPRGVLFKGKTVFHNRARLWDAARAEQDQEKKAEAIKRYEDYATWMEYQYGVLADSMEIADKAVTAAGLTCGTVEAEKLYKVVRHEFLAKHSQKAPSIR